MSFFTQSPRHFRKRRWFGFPRRHGVTIGVRRQRRFLPTAVFAVAIATILGASTLLVTVAWVSRSLPNPANISARRVTESTRIYDRTGETLLYEIYTGEKRTYKKLEQIPAAIRNATIVIEDQDFYTHSGFSLRGIIRAFFSNILSGNRGQGGSTITQQFIKRSILTSEKTYIRKLKEIILAFEIERRFSKKEILEMYLNEINYGGTNYGVESAAQFFFGKHTEDISIAESAILAALPQAPSRLSPYGTHRDELIARQQYILKRMLEETYITQDDYDHARQQTLVFTSRKDNNNIIAPHFVLWVRDQLAQRYGDKRLSEGGLKVITSLDLKKQKIAEDTITEIVPKNEKQWQASNAALVALDTKTGQVLAMVGSRDYYDEKHDGNVNVALRHRQPGSSFKPIVYAAAFEKGYTPETLLWDVVTKFPTNIEGEYTPHNYDNKEHGVVSMRQALAGSLNIPAVKTLYLTGIGRVLDLAERLGYTTLSDRSRFGLSLVLGGGEVKLLEHVSTFATFAREGIRHEPTAILRVEDRDGSVLEEWKENEGTRALDALVTRRLNSILSDNRARAYVFGAQNHLILPDRPVAAKTGTTNDYRDAWTMGFTPSIAVGVWTGNNDNTPMKKGADGSIVAAPIWNTFMRRILTGTPIETFNAVEPEAVDKPVLRGEGLGETIVHIDRITGKLATERTPAHFIEDRRYAILKPILQFVNKDDPRGPVPDDPGRDPYYDSWLSAILEWNAKQEPDKRLTEGTPPTEYDDVHVQTNEPVIEILTPTDGTRLSPTTQPLSITVNATAPRGSIRRVEYTIDDIPLFTASQAPFSYTGYLHPNMAKGPHTLTTRAYDDVDNVGEVKNTFIVQ